LTETVMKQLLKLLHL